MTRSRRPLLIALALVAALLGLSGCSLAQLGTSPRPEGRPNVVAPTPTASAAPKPGTRKKKPVPPIVLRARATARFGTLVVDRQGRSLYRSDRDSTHPSRSRCTGACARAWPPAWVASPDQVRVAGIDPDLVGTLRHRDGRYQLTLAGHPLYRFAGDQHPGDLKGQCRDGVFFAVTPEGRKGTMTNPGV